MMQVLQVPVVKLKSLKKLLASSGPRIPLLGISNVPTTDDSLEQFLHHAGTLFGKDPTKWEKVGEMQESGSTSHRHAVCEQRVTQHSSKACMHSGRVYSSNTAINGTMLRCVCQDCR